MSRTAVKPSIRKRSMTVTARSEMSVRSMFFSTVSKWALIITCACPSIRPGISVLPPPSMLYAPSGASIPAPTCLIRLFSIRTDPGVSFSDFPSKILTLLIRV